MNRFYRLSLSLLFAATLAACGGQNLEESSLETAEISEGAPAVDDTSTDTTAPKVSSVSPTDAATNQAVGSDIAVTFSEAMSKDTIITDSTTTCAGTIQVSSDNFSTCVALSTTVSASEGDTVFTVDPASDLSAGTTYKVRVTTTAKDTANNPMVGPYTQNTGFTTASDSTAPTVSSVTSEGSSIDPSGTLSVTFSEAMDTSTLSSATSGTSCSGSLYLSKDSFSTCVPISSLSYSNSNKTVTLTPTNLLDFGQTFHLKVKSTAADSAGNTLGSDYTTTTGWTIRSPNWTRIDGGASNSNLNINTNNAASYPQIAAYNNEIYVAWIESSTVRVKKYSGSNSSWSVVDGGSGLSSGNAAGWPRMIVFNSKLWVLYLDGTAAGSLAVRAKYYDGSTWTVGDTGSSTNGISSALSTAVEYLAVAEYNSELYATTTKSNGNSYVVHVYKYSSDGTDWTRVDGGSGRYVNAVSNNATYPTFATGSTYLYLSWTENNFSYYDYYNSSGWGRTAGNPLALYATGNPSWGGSYDGTAYMGMFDSAYRVLTLSAGSSTIVNSDIRYSSSSGTPAPKWLQFSEVGSSLYAVFGEAALGQIRVSQRSATSASTWSLVDGGASTGLNLNTGTNATYPDITGSGGKIYITWIEGATAQVRVSVAQ